MTRLASREKTGKIALTGSFRRLEMSAVYACSAMTVHLSKQQPPYAKKPVQHMLDELDDD